MQKAQSGDSWNLLEWFGEKQQWWSDLFPSPHSRGHPVRAGLREHRTATEKGTIPKKGAGPPPPRSIQADTQCITADIVQTPQPDQTGSDVKQGANGAHFQSPEPTADVCVSATLEVYNSSSRRLVLAIPRNQAQNRTFRSPDAVSYKLAGLSPPPFDTDSTPLRKAPRQPGAVNAADRGITSVVLEAKKMKQSAVCDDVRVQSENVDSNIGNSADIQAGRNSSGSLQLVISSQERASGTATTVSSAPVTAKIPAATTGHGIGRDILTPRGERSVLLTPRRASVATPLQPTNRDCRARGTIVDRSRMKPDPARPSNVPRLFIHAPEDKHFWIAESEALQLSNRTPSDAKPKPQQPLPEGTFVRFTPPRPRTKLAKVTRAIAPSRPLFDGPGVDVGNSERPPVVPALNLSLHPPSGAVLL
mmetsp:Transcript_58324/g.136890  ORF Transcript_58324/g.136890 Transcript_58324/m.136890 type:complete len:419 (-) Transcript_58324:27-1283(-)